MIDFKPLSTAERDELAQALRRNAGDGAALLLDPHDTGFRGGADRLPVTDDEVIAAIRSVPCHYADARAVGLALDMLRASPEHVEDARQGVPVGNSVIGSLLSLQHGIPRQYAESAVLEALRIYDAAKAPATEGDDSHILTRSGQAPLRFQGDLIAEADGERVGGKEQNRWHELAVYRTAGGKYVLRVAYRTRWQGELDHDTAEVLDGAVAVANTLRDYDPTGPVQGYPTGDAYAERQARLLADVRRRYEALVSELLAGEEFAEEVP